MRKNLLVSVATLALGASLTVSTGCFNLGDLFSGLFDGINNDNNNNNDDNNDNDDDNDNDNDDGFALGATKTSISMHPDAALRVGSDVVAYGTGGLNGVDWIRPSANDTAGRGITNGSNFRSNALAVGNQTIFLVDGNFQVTTFNTQTSGMLTIDQSQIRLKNIPSGASDAGHIQAAGNYCVAICEESEVTDGVILKVIDMSGGTPVVIPLTQNPASVAEQVAQVAVTESGQIACATTDGKFYIYNVATPTAQPLLLEAGSPGIGDVQMSFDGTHILYQDDNGTPNTRIINASTGVITTLANNPSSLGVTLGAGSFGYFVNQSSADSNGSDFRSAIGTIAGLPTITQGETGKFIDGSTTNNGLFGFGQKMCVTPDGKVWFMSGSRSVGSGEYLQVSTGGAFDVVKGDGSDPFGCPATDVCASNNTLAFKTGSGTNTVVAYKVLNTTDVVNSVAQRAKP
ncbi:MAG: hypothetical protein IPM64_00515 [Phycisphaerales bacterium]|nr:hypothetical protein [Phycisphaerales bacterium]